MNLQLVHLEIKKDKDIMFEQVLNAASAYKAAIKIIGSRDTECMLVMSLDSKGNLTGASIAGVGNINYIMIKLREIFKYAIVCNAASLIMAHNHPSSTLEPSNDDINFTRQAIAAGDLLGIKVLDHLIVSDKEYLSLAEKTTLF